MFWNQRRGFEINLLQRSMCNVAEPPHEASHIGVIFDQFIIKSTTSLYIFQIGQIEAFIPLFRS